MRRIVVLLALISLFAAPLSIPGTLSAQNPTQQACYDEFGRPIGEVSTSPLCAATDDDDPIAGEDGVILQVINIISWVIGVASVIMVLLGGFKYITSNGDSNQIASAKNTVLYALVGIAVVVVAQALVVFVISNV